MPAEIIAVLFVSAVFILYLFRLHLLWNDDDE